MILIFSIENELSTSSVIKWLKHYDQEVVRINADDHTYKFCQMNNKGIFFTNTKTDHTYNLLDAKSCWWRRTGLSLTNFLWEDPKEKFIVDGFDLTPLVNGNKSLLKSEAISLKKYIFKRIYDKCKINIGTPWTYSLNKLEVLDIAREEGLKVPYYEIISKTNQILQSKIQTEFVTKSIAEGIYEVVDNYSFYSYTELNLKENYKESEIPLFPSMIMDVIRKKMEIRTFYLDDSFYSMAIMSQSSDQTKTDFRKYLESKPNKCEVYKLPEEIEQKLKRIFKRLTLNSGSVDLIVNQQDEYVFLEINPVGQYAMTSEPCNYNLDKEIAKYLIHGNTK
ncbi:grasp-with-spasm system ATP-grasp peptide maturase [Sinomicrobium sp. M5D2P9]